MHPLHHPSTPKANSTSSSASHGSAPYYPSPTSTTTTTPSQPLTSPPSHVHLPYTTQLITLHPSPLFTSHHLHAVALTSSWVGCDHMIQRIFRSTTAQARHIYLGQGQWSFPSTQTTTPAYHLHQRLPPHLKHITISNMECLRTSFHTTNQRSTTPYLIQTPTPHPHTCQHIISRSRNWTNATSN